mmetsp:Transcript_1131/g.2103  ORF Transcript_1131/g.2103 Transcript_1131/m.2103 type:complete len:183 (+) Transcript_1131:167-715(+)
MLSSYGTWLGCAKTGLAETQARFAVGETRPAARRLGMTRLNVCLTFQARMGTSNAIPGSPPSLEEGSSETGRVQGGLNLVNGSRGAAKELEGCVLGEGEGRAAVLLCQVTSEDLEASIALGLGGAERLDVGGSVAAGTGHGHLNEGGDARGHLDKRGKLRKGAHKERVGLEGGHVDPAVAAA